ncbi:MAG: electron transport complex subunit RsxG [Gammaproteobacteria bacterium]|jgi:electron transport complex protein RnfG|nr:electron transport complex subunit RsxG [Gammaproteobacteria bacterium]MDH3905405.1 electron transport complex subunit RsxG [Gammaproteobacteria bacterium]MDH3954779.1 electron transport complex subunit RsxG [Gammaproteobacteria bacterium]MDH4006289.1 electron transport complex subunit RsxG [Gammaproteobacteria bacterium]NCF58906.1 electron transport complex subunit RsxG [Gammaproteobacteria bacterium]
MTPGVAKRGITLAAIAAICTTLVAATYHVTAPLIAANEQAWLERSLKPAFAGVDYEGSITAAKLILEPPHGLPGNDTAIIYRAYSGGSPAAALFAVTARGGYAGPIRILVGIDVAGAITGVRILEHRETPGLGDGIEESRSDWIHQFDRRSLGDPPAAGWQLQVDGGEFDQLTGASVTPRAVIKGVRETLLYFDANREEIFTMPATSEAP